MEKKLWYLYLVMEDRDKSFARYIQCFDGQHDIAPRDPFGWSDKCLDYRVGVMLYEGEQEVFLNALHDHNPHAYVEKHVDGSCVLMVSHATGPEPDCPRIHHVHSYLTWEKLPTKYVFTDTMWIRPEVMTKVLERWQFVFD